MLALRSARSRLVDRAAAMEREPFKSTRSRLSARSFSLWRLFPEMFDMTAPGTKNVESLPLITAPMWAVLSFNGDASLDRLVGTLMRFTIAGLWVRRIGSTFAIPCTTCRFALSGKMTLNLLSSGVRSSPGEQG